MLPPPYAADTSSLQVIALVSGGKDSIYSILHCLSAGHRIVALGNLYPPGSHHPTPEIAAKGNGDDETDLNSHMYQTVGHDLIPFLGEATDTPLYRAPILGDAVDKEATYTSRFSDDPAVDETESLTTLLKEILAKHPNANAVCTGAILSTYQRTRVENVCVRLGLTPLAFLWQYPSLFASEGEDALLKHMSLVGMEARIVKVASGGLSAEDLWLNVADPRDRSRIKRAIERFTTGEGAVIGEGGEYETIVVDGPDLLFKRRIEVDEHSKRVVTEEGGVAWLSFAGANIIPKGKTTSEFENPPTPPLLEAGFEKVVGLLQGLETEVDEPPQVLAKSRDTTTSAAEVSAEQFSWSSDVVSFPRYQNHERQTIEADAADSMSGIVDDLRLFLESTNRQQSDIAFVTLLLRSMKDFALVNTEYSRLFSEPNPPARACISLGSILPPSCPVVMYVNLDKSCNGQAAGLHVQSRSFWAPANIGPYSQARVSTVSSSHASKSHQDSGTTVLIAGQIPLVPATMAVVKSGHTDGGENEKSHDEFVLQTVLALQHVWRVGMATGVTFFCYGTAFLARCGLDLASRYAKLAGAAWRQLHLLPDAQASDDEDEEDMDPWDARNRRGFESMEGHRDVRTLPQWDLLETQSQGFSRSVSPFWASVVEELPRGVDVEWLPGMGLAGQHASICGDLGEGGFVHQIRIDETTVMVTILVRHDSSIRSLSALDMKTQALVREAIGPRSLLAPKLLTRHVDKDILRLPEDLNAIVPCQSIWDDAGQRLAAAVVLEYSM